MKKSIVLLLIALCLSLNLFAQDAESVGEEFRLIGFSNDGKYLAFEQFGYIDPSCQPYSNHKFVDIAKNSFALKSTEFVLENEYDCKELESARKQAAAKVKNNLQKLKIVVGNTGEEVFLNPSQEAKKHLHHASFKINGINYELKIIETTYKDVGYSREKWEFAKLKVTLQNVKTKSVQILQNDGKYKRGATGYILRSIYVYRGKIAVFIESGLQGWEASWSPEFMAVTGKIK